MIEGAGVGTLGSVIGKFYPPHMGHCYLIEEAQRTCGTLAIIVCAKPGQAPNGELRAAWLKESFPRAQVLLTQDDLDAEDSAAWAQRTRELLGRAPDLVCTSEDYGERYARELGCRHILVDRERRTVPVSGTRVRERPLAHWEYLPPAVRGYYALRICLVGAESTGKTTLAQALAEHYRTPWVPEYGRELSEEMLAKDGAYHWTSADFVKIARTQCERENALARKANHVLICDTDAFATAIWHRRYMGSICDEVEGIAAAHRKPDHYFLADVHTPFVQDGTRDGEEIRVWMHETFIEEMRKTGRSYTEIFGTHEARMRETIAIIDSMIAML